MIENILPGTKTKMKIVETIYENQGINVTSLIKITRVSPNFALSYINKLEDYKILKTTRIANKKSPVRNLFFNFSSTLALQIIALLEIEKRYKLLSKYSKLKPLFEQIPAQIKGFALLYGSYARLAADKESDIDLLIVDDKIDKNRLREIFVTFPEASLKVETTKQFLSNLSKPLYLNILREHVIINNEVSYLKTVRDYLK